MQKRNTGKKILQKSVEVATCCSSNEHKAKGRKSKKEDLFVKSPPILSS